MKIAADYRRAAVRAMIQHLVVLVMASLLLDGGAILRVTMVAVLCHWAAIALILARRPSSPSGLDLILVQYGFWPIAVGVMGIIPMIYRLKGVS